MKASTMDLIDSPDTPLRAYQKVISVTASDIAATEITIKSSTFFTMNTPFRI